MEEKLFKVISEFPFEFYDSFFTIALGSDGQLYLPFPLVCSALGVDANGQYQRCQRDEVFEGRFREVAYSHYPYGDAGELRPRTVRGLNIELLPYFLGGIDSARVRSPEAREKVVRFKKEFAKRAWAAFRSEILDSDSRAELDQYLPQDERRYLEAMDAATEIRLEMKQQTGRLEEVEERIATLEARLIATNTLNKAQTRQAQRMVKVLALALAKKRGVAQAVAFRDVYREIENRFNVPNYLLVKEADFSDMRTMLGNWYGRITPPGTPLPRLFDEPDQKSLF